MRGLRVDMRIAICEAFVDVMVNLKECCPSLTNDDLFYCILSSLHCSKTVIMELMNTTSDALKTRKIVLKIKWVHIYLSRCLILIICKIC